MVKDMDLYRRVSSMEPLVPASRAGELAELSAEVFRKSGELAGAVPTQIVRGEIAKLVQEMNSYYSNLIEGHKTLPRDIERALRQDFSEDDEDRRNQLLSVAHIRTEMAMRERIALEDNTNVYSPVFVSWLHDQFYSHLPAAEWFTTSIKGKRYPLVPGKFRDYNVDVGKHTPPDHPVLPAFAERFQTFYSDQSIPATSRLIAIAAAHHRLVWIHPFGDGNGRVARLQSQAAMVAAGVEGGGLWTLSRGLARAKPDYFKFLQAADGRRSGDLDGRGNLSDKALADWCCFFLRQVLDQMNFMMELISPFSLIDRIETYVQLKRTDLERKRRGHFVKLLKALCLDGEIKRGEVAGILGLKGTAARDVVRTALSEGLIQSPSEKGALRIALPVEVVDYYFPNLFVNLPGESE